MIENDVSIIPVGKRIFSFYEAVNDGEILIFPLQGFYKHPFKCHPMS